MKKYADIQDINDFELIEDLLKNIIKTSSLKNIETISIAKDALTVLRKPVANHAITSFANVLFAKLTLNF